MEGVENRDKKPLRLFGHLKTLLYVCSGQTVFENALLPPPLVPSLSARLRKVPPSGVPCAICFWGWQLRVSNPIGWETRKFRVDKVGFEAVGGGRVS